MLRTREGAKIHSEGGFSSAPPPQVGGSSSQKQMHWKTLGARPTVSTFHRGYHISIITCSSLLASTVDFPSYLLSPSRSRRCSNKGALKVVKDWSPSFYSCLFLVKASGGWRPITDLSPLNQFIQQTLFRMETASSVLKSIKEGDFTALLDLSGHISRCPSIGHHLSTYALSA